MKRRRVVHHDYCGFPLAVVIADREGALWYDHDCPAIPEVEVLHDRTLTTGATVFDVGAHQGVLAAVLASIVGSTGRVIAVDPVAHNVKLARENATLNGLGNVLVVHAAAARRVGTVRFSGFLTVQVGSRGQEVAATTVDDLASIHGAPAAVVVDVEGYEVEVLGGSARTLQADVPPDWVVECHAGCGLEDSGGSVQQVIDAFPPDAYTLLAASARPGCEFRPIDRSAPYPTERFLLAALALARGAT